MSQDYYALLGISQDASAQEVRKAFRGLAFSCHPDAVGEDAASTEYFIRIREAYDTLSDPGKREAYDADLRKQQREGWMRREKAPEVSYQRPPARSVYSPKYARERLRQPAEAVVLPHNMDQRGPADLFGTVTMELEDTLHPACFTIYIPGTEERSSRSVYVRIPGGIYPGAVLKIPGHGITPEGALLIETNFARHPRLRIAAGMLFFDLALLPWQAALGFQATIPTLEGLERLTVPPVVTTPQVMRIAERGLYRPDRTRGDLWVNLRLEVPAPESYRARQLWAELADEYRRRQN